LPRLAVVQKAPVFLDRDQTLRHVVADIAEAAAGGAALVVFPEAYIPGYPIWTWRLRPGGDFGMSEELHAGLLKAAVSLDGDQLSPVMDAAAEHKVTVVLGINERDTEFSGATLYNTVVVIGPDGRLLNRHRKLMPTNPERMVWGFGDASGLRVVDSPCGRLGTLLCWENYMPLARYALYAQGVEIHVAPTYDSGDGWLGTLQHIAREGGCWVVGCGCAFRGQDVPDAFPHKAELYGESAEWVNQGDSVVVAPGGKIVAGPLRAEQGLLYADADLDRVAASRRSLDVAGHYARPDVFTLHVDRRRRSPAEFEDQPQGEDE
jgi:nitrilase